MQRRKTAGNPGFEEIFQQVSSAAEIQICGKSSVWKNPGKRVVKEQAESLNLTIEKYIVCVGRKVVGENKIHTGDKWIEEFACINIFEEIFNDFGIQVLSDYNTATAEYNFILLFEKEEENAVCMEKALQACSKIQVEVERYLKAHMNFGLSDVEVDEYQANAQYRKAQTACRQCVYLGTNIILRYEDLQYRKADSIL